MDDSSIRDDLLSLLSEVAIIANSTRDPETALVLATEQICRHTGWDAGHAFTVDGDDLESTGVWHLEGDLDLCSFGDDTIAGDFSHGQGLPGRVAAGGRAVLIPELSTDHDFQRRNSADESGIRSAFAFPVMIDTKVVAVLEFFSTDTHPPDAHLMDTMGQIGMQLGRVFEREEARLTAERNEREVRQILDSAGDAYIGMDPSGIITEWNRTAEKILGWSRSEAIGQPVTELIIPPEYREAHNRGVERLLMTGEPRVLGQHLEMSALHREGHEFPIDITMWSQRTEHGWNFYAFIRDISARKRQEREREYRSSHDDLTGLPNRMAFVEQLGRLVDRASPRTSVAVFAIEIDQLGRTIDNLGQESGDMLLVAVSKRILGVVRPDDMVARANGDTLLVSCGFRHDDGFDPVAAARRIGSVLEQPLRLDRDSTFVSAGIGIAVVDDVSSVQESDPEGLIVSAKAALREAQSTGHGSIAVFDERMQAATTRRIRLESDLRRAIENHELALHYQPLVDARTGVVTGVEALLRWSHPTEGPISPAEFIPLAEQTGLIVPMGRWVIDEAIRQALRWQNRPTFPHRLKIAVNLSARQLAQSDIVGTIRDALGRVTLDPERVHIAFEVTESLLMEDPAKAEKTLGAIRELGAELSIDDFGTGYSSLSYLKRFPVQTVKLDRSFVINIGSDPADRAIASSVIDLSHALGMTVVAEGVETAEQLQILGELGADTIQGFLFSRPRPAADLEDIIFGDPFVLPSSPGPLTMEAVPHG